MVKLISELKESPLSEFPFNNTDVFVLVDENTLHHCFPKIASHINVKAVITIKAGEEHKTLAACEKIWQVLTENNADRNALLINLGGGMVCDVGGFAAACYKRGIQFIHIPTTLLAMVDAAIGGKTGIDFMGFKNQVGVFCMPQQVIIHTEFLQTLPERELKAGFAEVIKHYLIYDKEAFYELTQLSALPHEWEKLVDKNVKIKQHFTDADPTEQGIRKALNFGHTIGHALESYYLKDEYTNLLHGEAVAAGMIAESFISYKREMITEAELADIVHYILRTYNLPHLPELEFNNIVQLVRQDKKNATQVTRCVLLQGIGSVSIDNAVDDNLIKEALQYYNSIVA